MGFICIKGWLVALLLFFIYLMKMKLFGLTETKIFIFIGYLKTGVERGGGGFRVNYIINVLGMRNHGPMTVVTNDYCIIRKESHGVIT